MMMAAVDFAIACLFQRAFLGRESFFALESPVTGMQAELESSVRQMSKELAKAFGPNINKGSGVPRAYSSKDPCRGTK
jgi:hypothetical protein